MAIANYDAVPFKKAEGRDSFSGKEVVYSFDDPQFDFGRVVVRSKQSNSVVRRDLFVGFSGNDLRVGTKLSGKSGSSIQIDAIEIWLKVRGQIRPGGTYEWETQFSEGERKTSEGGVPAIIPAFWADGQPIGVDVAITEPEQEDTDRIQRLLLPHGSVKIPNFERQTGGAWIVLKPKNFGTDFAISRFSFREADTAPTADAQAIMPTPVRYIAIRSEVEDKIAEALDGSEKALKRLQNKDHFWSSGNDLEGNVSTTAAIAYALAELNPKDEDVHLVMKWLAAQEPPRGGAFGVATVAARLACLARHGTMTDFGPTIQADAQFLVDAQLEDGGWGERPQKSAVKGAVAAVNSNHDFSLTALTALREARFAGAVIDSRVWRNALRYWTDAEASDGSFTHRLARYGSISQPSIAFTATGAAGLIISLDMASGIGSKRCSTYLSSKEQLRAIDKALKWLDERYEEEFRSLGSFGTTEDPYLEPERLETLGEVSGLSHFNEKNHFVESARKLLDNYDQNTGMFGIRGQAGGLGIGPGAFKEAPSPRRTAAALATLGAGNAPTVVQRIIAGDGENGWGQYRGDAPHLVRYLAAKSGRPFNWRRTSIDREVRDLVEVPITLLSVVGAFNWAEADWNKIREYCLAGGTLVLDIGDEAEEQRGAVESGLRRAFPEYQLAELPADAAVFAVDKSHQAVKRIKAMGNGFRHFMFLPPRSWSCAWHTSETKEHEESFAFMQDLLNYATDGTPPRSSFTRSTYATTAASSRSMKASRIQVGGAVPAYPNLIATMDRLMQSNFRMRVEETNSPSDADLIWVNVAGSDPPSEDVRKQLLDAMRGEKRVFIDVVSGNVDWDAGLRAVLAGLDPGIALEKLRRNDPVFTGEIAGTQGFDVVDVPFRKALHTRFAKTGRCDLYAIYLKGRQVGLYSAYDISSGIGYHYFPGCRGVMPEPARGIAMNVFLSCYAEKAASGAHAEGR